MIKVVEGRNQIERLARVRARIKKLEKLEAELTDQAKEHIKKYGSLREGCYQAVLQIINRVCPKWKDEYILKLGKEVAEEVIKNTQPSVCEKVEVYKEGRKIA